VWDRETVRRVRDIAVLVLGEDSIPYSAVTDTGGNFAFRGLPVGDYWAFAFRDQNRNRTLERDFEPHDSGRVSLSDSTAIVQLELWLTPPDSTAPFLASVGARDSLTLRLEFDDLLEPDASLDGASVGVVEVGTGEEWPIAEFVIGDLAPAGVPEEGVEPDSRYTFHCSDLRWYPFNRENAAFRRQVEDIKELFGHFFGILVADDFQGFLALYQRQALNQGGQGKKVVRMPMGQHQSTELRGVYFCVKQRLKGTSRSIYKNSFILVYDGK